MAIAKGRTAKKAAKGKKAPTKAAVTRFTSRQKVATRKGQRGEMWLLMGPLWLQSTTRRPGDERTKRAALRQLRSFRKRTR